MPVEQCVVEAMYKSSVEVGCCSSQPALDTDPMLPLDYVVGVGPLLVDSDKNYVVRYQ